MKYSIWLQGALEAYVAAARTRYFKTSFKKFIIILFILRQDKTFVPEYPVLKQLLQGGLDAL